MGGGGGKFASSFLSILAVEKIHKGKSCKSVPFFCRRWYIIDVLILSLVRTNKPAENRWRWGCVVTLPSWHFIVLIILVTASIFLLFVISMMLPTGSLSILPGWEWPPCFQMVCWGSLWMEELFYKLVPVYFIQGLVDLYKIILNILIFEVMARPLLYI